MHVQDVARAFQAVLEAPRDLIHNQAFNTGADDLNHQIRELGQIVADTLPGCSCRSCRSAGADQRTYKADFGKFKRAFPDFRFLGRSVTEPTELRTAFEGPVSPAAQFIDKRFTRLDWLRHLLDQRHVATGRCAGREPRRQVA